MRNHRSSCVRSGRKKLYREGRGPRSLLDRRSYRLLGPSGRTSDHSQRAVVALVSGNPGERRVRGIQLCHLLVTETRVLMDGFRTLSPACDVFQGTSTSDVVMATCRTETRVDKEASFFAKPMHLHLVGVECTSV